MKIRPDTATVLRGGEDADKWYSLMNYVGDDICWTWEQLQPMNVQVCCAMSYQLYRNGALVTQRPIKVEKQEVIGFSVTQKIDRVTSYCCAKMCPSLTPTTMPKITS